MLYFGLHWSEQLRVAPAIELTDEQASELTRQSWPPDGLEGCRLKSSPAPLA